MGKILDKLNRLDEAEVVYKKIIELKPDYFRAHHNLALTLNSNNKLDEALKYWKNAKVLKPDADFLFGIILYLKIQLNIWDDLQSELQELTKKINNGTIVLFRKLL